MAKNKTTQTTKSVDDFISAIAVESKRDDSYQLIEIYKSLTGFDPVMWGPSMIGFGKYHYKYESGHEGDMPIGCFSPRKAAIVLYLLSDFGDRDEFLKKLGKHKPSGGCVYIKKLEDVDLSVLKKMIAASIKSVQKKYPTK